MNATSQRKTGGILIALLITVSIAFSLNPLHAAAVGATVVSQVVHYTANDGADFLRSTSPMSLPVTGGGDLSQAANGNGSVTISLNGVSGYADSGFTVDAGKLGDLNGLLVQGTGDDFNLNLWFDVDNNGEYFAWTGDTYTGTGGDAYILGHDAGSGGNLEVTDATQFDSLQPGGGNYTLAQLKAGAASGITADTNVHLWIGVCCNGSRSTTISSLFISSGPITDVYVDDDYSAGNAGGHLFGVDAFDNIQDGLDAAAAGGTVHVAAGTYPEQLLVSHSVHLVGAGVGASIIQAPVSLPDASQQTSAIVIISGSGVQAELTGFTVSGPGPTACGSIRAGIFVRSSADANIHGNTIQAIRDEPFGGCQNGVAILVGRNAWATTGTATISNNTIVDYQKGAIVVDNAGSNATITNNTVTGAGTTGVTAENGIQISRGATATLSGNTVTGNSYHKDPPDAWDWSATGILLYQSGAVTFSGGNTLSANDSNLYTDGGTLTLGAETFGGSSAPADAGADIWNDGSAAMDATSATFTGAADGFAIEDRVHHALDDASVGLVTWTAGNVYVTTSSGSIQRGIDAVVTGGSVHVAAATFDEVITANKTVSLLGARAGVDARGRTGAETVLLVHTGGTSAVTMSADNVLMDGFTVACTGAAHGQCFGVRASSGPTSSVHITNSIFRNLYEGVHVQGPATNVATNLKIDQNVFVDESGDPYAMDAGIWMASAPSTGVTIDNNAFSGHGGGDTVGDYAAINLDLATNAEITNNTSTDDATFLVLVDNQDLLVEDNTVTGNVGSTIFVGLGNDGLTIQGNSLSSGFRAVRFANFFGTGLNQNVSILDNTITGMSDKGIFIPANTIGVGEVTIEKNRVTGNGAGLVHEGANAIDASPNWWGSLWGPQHSSNPFATTGDTVSDHVTFSPWCANVTCTSFAPPFATITTITDTPDPSAVGQLVTFQFTVASEISGAPVPEGVVDIPGICSGVVLDASGHGSCTHTYSSINHYRVTATFTPDAPTTSGGSSGSTNHDVVNGAPHFTSTPGLSATTGSAYTYNAAATDPDTDALTFGAPTLPAWLVLTDHHDGTATLSGTPTAANLGANPVVISVSDGVNTAVTQSFTINVLAANVPLFSVSPTSWNFGMLKLGTTSAGKLITVTNTGTGDLVMSGLVTLSGTNASQFQLVSGGDHCSGATVTPGHNCTVVVAFRPTTAGSKSASLGFPDNAAGHPHSVALSGKGGVELAINGGFNLYPGNSKIPTQWVASQFSAADGKDLSTKKEGAASLKITGQLNKSKTLTQTRMLGGPAGNAFALSLWSKGTSIPAAGVARAQVLFYNGNTLVQTKTVNLPTGTYGFTQRNLNFTATQAYTKIVIKLTYGKGSGTLWVDSLTLLRSPN